jgi:murein DD-endopeptidase MepM/ murein hydrolase activator NlpD
VLTDYAEIINPMLKISSPILRYFPILLLVTLVGCSSLERSLTGKRDIYHEVRSGDTLAALGARYGVDPLDIQSYNGISDPRTLRIGQMIVIPALGPVDLTDIKGSPQLKGEQTAGDRAQLKLVSIAPVRGYIGQLGFPVEHGRHSSRFGWRWKRFHEGVDLAAPEGTPVLAAHDGIVVLESESWGRYGKVVVVKGNGLMTVYAHNSKNRVKKGSRVRRGEEIAKVGATGDASAPHLHFETRVIDASGRFAAVNPVVFFP